MCESQPCGPVPVKTLTDTTTKQTETCEPEIKKVCKVRKKKPVVEEPECVEPEPPPFVSPRPLFSKDSKDPYEAERKKCLDNCHVKPVHKILIDCEERVSAKLLYTSENCHEETVDLIEAIDRCMKSTAFMRLE